MYLSFHVIYPHNHVHNYRDTVFLANRLFEHTDARLLSCDEHVEYLTELRELGEFVFKIVFFFNVITVIYTNFKRIFLNVFFSLCYQILSNEDHINHIVQSKLKLHVPKRITIYKFMDKLKKKTTYNSNFQLLLASSQTAPKIKCKIINR